MVNNRYMTEQIGQMADLIMMNVNDAAHK